MRDLVRLFAIVTMLGGGLTACSSGDDGDEPVGEGSDPATGEDGGASTAAALADDPSKPDRDGGQGGTGGDAGGAGGSAAGSGGAGGQGEDLCATSRECSPGTTETSMQACGMCGSQTQSRRCNDQCQWEDWGDWGSCSDEGMCMPGDTREQDVPCGPCEHGLETQTSVCLDSCEWGNWEGGECKGAGECMPGSTRAADDTSCGLCDVGVQEMQEVCSDECAWSAPESVGECQETASCDPSDGETTEWRPCSDGTCRVQATVTSCDASTCEPTQRTEACDACNQCDSDVCTDCRLQGCELQEVCNQSTGACGPPDVLDPDVGF